MIRWIVTKLYITEFLARFSLVVLHGSFVGPWLFCAEWRLWHADRSTFLEFLVIDAARPDHFSRVASHYAQARPTYPDALFQWLATLCARRELAVDVGAGTGQATLPLALRFGKVVGIDASAEQLKMAAPAPNIEYRAGPAEDLPIADASADLLVVAQALHWFDLERFWPEVRRLLRSDGAVAVWTYGLLAIDDPDADAVVQDFYRQVVGPWWPAGRKHVENGYANLSFPFEPIAAPGFEMTVCWDLPDFLGYVRSWSATGGMVAGTGHDPVPALEQRLQAVWREARTVSWPLRMRAGRPR